LVLAITGRCDSIYKIKISKDKFATSTYTKFAESGNTNTDIFATTYDHNSQALFYGYKKYNSDQISLHTMSMIPENPAPSPVLKTLGKNDTNPVLAFDSLNGFLYFASADYDHIYKISGNNINSTTYLIATLPPNLKSVSSMGVIGDFLYLVTWEPDAQLARIQISQHFCLNFCGTYGFCLGQPSICACANGFSQNMTSEAKSCVPKHEIDIDEHIKEERGVAIALGVLFFVALIAAAAGWAMWWRSRKSVYTSVD